MRNRHKQEEKCKQKVLLQISLDAGLLQALTAVVAAYILIVTGIIGWFMRELLTLKRDFYRLDQSLRGTEDAYDEGLLGRNFTDLKEVHQRLDKLDKKLDNFTDSHKDSSQTTLVAVMDAMQILGEQQRENTEAIENLRDD